MAIVKFLKNPFDFSVHFALWHRHNASDNLQRALDGVRVERTKQHTSRVGSDDDPGSICLHGNIALLASGSTQLVVKGPFLLIAL